MGLIAEQSNCEAICVRAGPEAGVGGFSGYPEDSLSREHLLLRAWGYMSEVRQHLLADLCRWGLTDGGKAANFANMALLMGGTT